jgi:eukaryotic-like serine/threonine-protein kinase
MDATERLPTGGAGARGARGDGLVLGRYRLGRRLGSGGFGTVFAAHDERLDRSVAVKVMPAGGPAPERGPREALAAARLHHPGIVAVYDAGEDEAGRYLVSELVRGRTLAALEAEGALSDRDVLRVGLALAAALGHAHERGVIHRDVKPQNVIVADEAADPRAVAKLADFGVAHLAGDEPLTRTGDVVGTLAYMAPEQAAGERVDERADLYSVALVLYEALAGTNPMRASSPAATARLVGKAPPPLGRRRRDLPDELCAALDRALAPEPGARGTLGALADALAAALPAVSDEGGTIAPHPLERAAGVRPPRVRARIAAGVAAGALAAAALIAAGDPAALGLDTATPRDPATGLVAVGDDLVVAAAAFVAVLVALLPRAGWLLMAAGCAAVLAGPHPDAATLVAAAAAAPPLLLQRSGLAWSLPAVAPALGLAGLAGAYPALAGRTGGMWTRAALGAIGMWWLLLTDPDQFLGTAPDTAGTVLEDLASSGALLLIPVWAAAALVLPWLVPGRALALDVVGASAWAAATVAATAAVAEETGLPEPRGLVLGAVAGAALALFGARAAGTVKAGRQPA